MSSKYLKFSEIEKVNFAANRSISSHPCTGRRCATRTSTIRIKKKRRWFRFRRKENFSRKEKKNDRNVSTNEATSIHEEKGISREVSHGVKEFS